MTAVNRFFGDRARGGPGGSGPSDAGFDSPVSDWYNMTKQRIVKLIGPPHAVRRLCEMGLYPGQTVQVIRPGVWKIDGRFTMALRLTNVEIVLE